MREIKHNQNTREDEDDRDRLLVGAVLSSMFPTYRYMTIDTRARFRRFCDDMLSADTKRSDEPSHDKATPLLRLLQLLDVELLVMSQDGHIADGRNCSIALRHINASIGGDIATNSTVDKKLRNLPPKGDTDLLLAEHGRDVRKLNKDFKKVIQTKDRRKRLLAFMRTGIRGEVVTADTKTMNHSNGIQSIRYIREDGFRRTWRRLGVWHRRKAFKAYIDKIKDGVGGNDPGASVELLRSIRTAIMSGDNMSIMRLPEPLYNHHEGRIEKLLPPTSENTTVRTSRPSKKQGQKKKKKKKKCLLLEMKRIRAKRQNLENRSVCFTGTFVTIN